MGDLKHEIFLKHRTTDNYNMQCVVKLLLSSMCTFSLNVVLCVCVCVFCFTFSSNIVFLLKWLTTGRRWGLRWITTSARWTGATEFPYETKTSITSTPTLSLWSRTRSRWVCSDPASRFYWSFTVITTKCIVNAKPFSCDELTVTANLSQKESWLHYRSRYNVNAKRTGFIST